MYHLGKPKVRTSFILVPLHKPRAGWLVCERCGSGSVVLEQGMVDAMLCLPLFFILSLSFSFNRYSSFLFVFIPIYLFIFKSGFCLFWALQGSRSLQRSQVREVCLDGFCSDGNPVNEGHCHMITMRQPDPTLFHSTFQSFP
ncbi:hypothetical protein BDV29DRAFT_186375 [Aspergillus leporis]|jgi:hypothetical protein|uniref:Uncharacterized protein n=1 Tax=Aspergillus leporis TaxID=41062 RepID=A0A5N5WG98_9EURO|nr:hypothetical protein BDV29DRAFT_186375 [Aspergillus leporis]